MSSLGSLPKLSSLKWLDSANTNLVFELSHQPEVPQSSLAAPAGAPHPKGPRKVHQRRYKRPLPEPQQAQRLRELGATETEIRRIIEFRPGTALRLAQDLLEFFSEEDEPADGNAWLMAVAQLEGLKCLCQNDNCKVVVLVLTEGFECSGILPEGDPRRLKRLLTGAQRVLRSSIYAGIRLPAT